MRQKDLIKKMTTREVLGWMAFDLSNDKDFAAKVKMEKELKRQKAFTAEQEAEAVKNLFRTICG